METKYSVILKGKRSEQTAVQKLTNRALDRIFITFEVPPIPVKFKKEVLGEVDGLKHSIEEHLDSFQAGLNAKMKPGFDFGSIMPGDIEDVAAVSRALEEELPLCEFAMASTVAASMPDSQAMLLGLKYGQSDSIPRTEWSAWKQAGLSRIDHHHRSDQCYAKRHRANHREEKG